MSSLNLFCAIHLTLLGLSLLATVGFIITHIRAFSGSSSEILLRPLFPLLPLPSVLPAKCDLIDTCSPEISIYKWPALWLIPSVTCLSATPLPLPLWPLFLLPQLTPAFAESDCEGFGVRSLSLHCLKPLHALFIKAAPQCFSCLWWIPSGRLHIENSKHRLLLKSLTQLPYPSLLAYNVFFRIQRENRAHTSQSILRLLIYLKYISSCLLSVSLEEGAFFLLKAKPLTCVLNPLSIIFLLF